MGWWHYVGFSRTRDRAPSAHGAVRPHQVQSPSVTACWARVARFSLSPSCPSLWPVWRVSGSESVCKPEPRGVASAPFPQPGSFVQSAPTWPLPVGHCACFWGYEGDPCSRCWSPRERNHYTNGCITGDSVALPQDFVNLPPNSPQRTSIHSAGRKRGGGKDILGLPWVAGRWRRVEESAGTSRCHRASPKRKLTRVG